MDRLKRSGRNLDELDECLLVGRSGKQWKLIPSPLPAILWIAYVFQGEYR